MIYKLFLSFVFIGLIVSSSNASVYKQDGKLNKTDGDGKKQGKWIYFGSDRPEEGYPATGKIEEGTYKDDRKEGIWIKYHNDGVTPRLRGEFVNNRPQGNYTKYYANGKVKEVGSFERNQYRDSLIRYRENGKVEYQANYNAEGKEQGKVKYYFPNGQVEFEYTSQNGVAVGKATRYYENGDVKEELVFGADGGVLTSKPHDPVNPIKPIVNTGAVVLPPPPPPVPTPNFLPNGYNKVYNKNAEISQDGVFKKGRLWDGKVYEYDSDGILLKVKIFKNGSYHSDGQL